MKQVKIYKLRDNGDQDVIATYKLLGLDVVFEGDETFINNVNRNGIRDYAIKDSTAIKLFPKDGIRFLENLKFAFQSGYLVASDIEES
jgi:hypothetical protein